MEGSSAHLRCSVHIDLCAMERNLGKLRHFMGREKGYIALLSADAFGYGVEAATKLGFDEHQVFKTLMRIP